MRRRAGILPFLVVFLLSPPVIAGEPPSSPSPPTVTTVWPLFDYRATPAESFSNLGVLGPVVKRQHKEGETVTAVRPFWYQTTDDSSGDTSIDILYPLASLRLSSEGSFFQVLKVLDRTETRADDPDGSDSSFMLFPLYMQDDSPQYGFSWSLFPLYGDIYGKFGRDEIHYALFPLYGRTVRRGTTNTNILWPIVTVTSGRESGFSLWPLYGSVGEDGVSMRRFALWPIYQQTARRIGTPEESRSLTIFPLYHHSSSPRREVTDILWPFFGHEENRGEGYERWNYLWPLLWSAQGKGRDAVSILPLYLTDRTKNREKQWYLWPLYRTERYEADGYRNETDRVLFFLHTRQTEEWKADGSRRTRSALWPLYTYRHDPDGTRRITFPAPVEPIFPREGVENSWAPLWRILIARWNDQGESALSLFWNLYWEERRKEGVAWELFPLLRYSGDPRHSDFLFLKGMIRYRTEGARRKLSFFWFDAGLEWDGNDEESRQ